MANCCPFLATFFQAFFMLYLAHGSSNGERSQNQEGTMSSIQLLPSLHANNIKCGCCKGSRIHEPKKPHLHSCETEDNIWTGTLGPTHGSRGSTRQWCEPPISYIRDQMKEDKKTFAAEELFISSQLLFLFFTSWND